MLRLGILLFLLAPGASAWAVTIEAPAEGEEAIPFVFEVCAEGEGRGQVRAIAENATLDAREDRYLPGFEARACRKFEAIPANGTVEIEARVRREGGSAIEARAFANVTIRPAPAMRVRILEARAPPMEGIVLLNEGEAPIPLARLRLNGDPFSNGTLGANATIFVPLDVRAGDLRLTQGTRVLDSLLVPKLRAGEGTLGKYGRTAIPAAPLRIEGDLLGYATSVAPVVELIEGAREEVLVEAYTLTSPDVAAALARAADRGARVRVLLEGAPVGGVPADERALVATLQARGAEVVAIGGEGARYRTVHSKLVVADRAAASVATENLGEGDARGYGLVVRDAALARQVAEVILADMDGYDIRAFDAGEPPGEALARVGVEAETRAFRGARNATLVLSPDDPRALARAIAAARVSVDVQMLRAEPEGPMIDALVSAAREGARVRLLLDGRYDDGTNREAAARLAALAEREGLRLEAKLDEPDRTLHAKAFVVDARLSYVGSMNWVRAAIEDNREAGLLVEGEDVASWLGDVMEKEWAGPSSVEVREVSAPPVGWILLLVLFVGLHARRVEVERERVLPAVAKR